MPRQHPPIELRSGTPVIPYGPGLPYETVNNLPDWVADAKLSIINAATGVVSACCWVFNNEGDDACVAGRPANLIALLAPTNAFRVDFVLQIKKTATVAQYVFDLSDNDTPQTHQLSLFFNQNTNVVTLRVGAEFVSHEYTLPSVVTTLKVSIISNGTSTDLYIDGVKKATVTNGAVISTGNINLGGTYRTASYNAEATFAYYAFYNGSGVLVDCYDFTDPTKWNGGSTMVSCAGNTAKFTKVSPLTERIKAAIPRELLVY